MKLYYYLLGIVLILVVSGCSSDSAGLSTSGGISGSVSDKTTGEPVPTASVMLKENGKSTVTGYDGSFSFANLEPGTYTVEVSKDGYSESSKVVSVRSGETTPAHLLIERLPASITADKNSLEFNSQIETLSFTILNRSYRDLKYIVEKGACKWLEINPTQGVLQYGKTETIVVNLLRDQLPMGSNEAVIIVRSLSGDGNVEIKVTAVNGKSTATVNTLPASDVDSNSATLNGEVSNPGEPRYTERGFVYSTKSTPTVEDCLQKLSSPVNDEATFSCSIQNLTALATYYVRTYVVQNGEVIYGNVVSFTSSQQNTVVSTSAVTSVGATSATLNGSITNAGSPAFTEKGFCCSANNSSPTISDTKIPVSGTSTGDYSQTITNLSYPTTYYVRAYAIQSGKPIYGDVVSFSTSLTSVTVTTSAATSITSSAATFNGYIDKVGSPAYTEKGFCMSSNNYSPTINDVKVIVSGTGAGNFSTRISNLDYDSKYYYRAYAIQAGKVVYGNTQSFVTNYTPATVLTNNPSNVAYTTVTFNGDVTNLGDPSITERGFCYNTYSSYSTPNISDTRIRVNGISGGTYKADITGLSENTKYSVRAYVIQNGQPIYGSTKTIETGQAPYLQAAVLNIKGSGLSTWEAEFRGGVVDGDPAITEVGFVYSNTNNPTVTSGTKVIGTVASADGSIYYFKKVVTNLSSYKTYYVRAYAKNSLGYTYSETVSFNTY